MPIPAAPCLSALLRRPGDRKPRSASVSSSAISSAGSKGVCFKSIGSLLAYGEGVDGRNQVPRRHVFAINSSPAFLNVVRELFQEEGYNVTTTNFAPNSFAQIEALRPDALIIDIAIGQEAGSCWSSSMRMPIPPASRSSSSRPIPGCWRRPRRRQGGTGDTAFSKNRWTSRRCSRRSGR